MDNKLIDKSIDLFKILIEYKDKDAREMSEKEALKLGKKMHSVKKRWEKFMKETEA